MKALLISDFNLNNFAGYLRNAPDAKDWDVVVAPLGQVVQTLGDLPQTRGAKCEDSVFVWTRPEAVLPAISSLLQGLEGDDSALDAEVDDFARSLLHAADATAAVLVTTWVIPDYRLGSGTEGWRAGFGVRRLLARANLRLADAVGMAPNVFILPAESWMQAGGTGAFNARLWYSAKIPWSNEVLKSAASDVALALKMLRGGSRKLIVLDLDDTLWGGIVGDVGWEGLVLGGHDPEGEALVDFQNALKTLSRRGVALGILSKNTEATALDAIRRHPEMVLREEDFAGWRINWSDKAQNLADLVKELNLGLDSVVFIDDNPVERARVREAFPQVLVPDWPLDKRLYPQALADLRCFGGMGETEEDRRRSRMYAEQRKRNHVKESAGSVEGWLERLEQVVTAGPVDRSNRARVVQLLNKTNQMNLSTRRLSEAEFDSWAAQTTRRAWALRVADRFGDSGLTGVLSVEVEGAECRIIDFVLSCRVMGRKVEEIMLKLACEWARRIGAETVIALYQPTARNQPCLELLRKSGFEERREKCFVWQPSIPYPAPEAVKFVSTDEETIIGVGATLKANQGASA
jgi:FkbH-like protein